MRFICLRYPRSPQDEGSLILELPFGAIAGDGVVLDKEIMAELQILGKIYSGWNRKREKGSREAPRAFSKKQAPQQWKGHRILLVDDRDRDRVDDEGVDRCPEKDGR